VRTRWIVGADGGRSLVRRWCGLEAGTDCGRRFACRRHYRVRPWSGFTEIYWGRDMQAYVTPVGACEMCMVVISYGRRSAWEEAWREFPSLAKRMSAAVMTSAERGTLTGTHSLERVYRSNVALVGDASGSVDAITGEGLRLSFLHALALAEALEANDLGRYQAAHGKLARWPARMGRLMLYLGSHGGLRKRAMRAFSLHPELLGQLLAIHLGESSAAQLATATAQLGWGLLAA
jgi:2-polyprenyl-6-methoxyphenol hydroxylase-like FAD-dependent oxidoreductase